MTFNLGVGLSLAVFDGLQSFLDAGHYASQHPPAGIAGSWTAWFSSFGRLTRCWRGFGEASRDVVDAIDNSFSDSTSTSSPSFAATSPLAAILLARFGAKPFPPSLAKGISTPQGGG